MQRFDPATVQPADLDLDDAALTVLLNAKDHINDMTAKSIEIKLPSGEISMISPLEQAQQTKNKKLLDLFFQQAEKLYKRAGNKVDVKYVDDVKHGRTILFWAIATFQSAECIEALKKENSNFSQEVYRDDHLETYPPIFYAIFIDNPIAVAALLKNNPELIMQESEYGRTPAHYAAELHRFDILDMLYKLNKRVARIRTTPELTPLHFVIATGDTNNDALRWLLDHDYHSDEEPGVCDIGDTNHVTPLHLGIIQNNPEAVRLLLEHGADFNAVTGPYATPPNKTALQLAADAGNNDIMRLLLKHGARPEPKPEPGMAARHPIDPSKLSERMQIVLSLLSYREDRGKKKKHTRTFLGITDINISSYVAIKVVYSRKDKRNAVDALVNAILDDPKDEKDPLEGMAPEIIGPLKQGELSEIVQPLIDEHDRRVKEKNSPNSTPRRSPSPSGRSSE